MRAYLTVAVFIILFVVPSVTFAEDKVCLKKVFHNYCLGGPVEDLPKSLHQYNSKFGYVYAFKDGIDVFSFKGRIFKITKLLAEGKRYTWLKYLTITGKLKEKYGEPEDHSYFPAYADDPSDKETQIHIGGGEIIYQWHQKGWRVLFSWTENLAALFYLHDELYARMEEEASTTDEGL